MYAILVKELNSFFASLTGLIAAVVFLVVNGLFMWVFPGELNVLDSGYASLETLFIIAPWVFMFLVPAITMRTLSEEKKSGTIELLLTRPISDFQILAGKYFAAIILVFITLVPALVFFISVYWLGNPVGNIDSGATWGALIGLFFLASGYVAIGVFSSSLSDNQIVAFILAIAISFFFFMGFESIASLQFLKNFELALVNLGINEHYRSLSRGVIDSRDVIYFACLSAFFLLLAQLVLKSRKW